MKLGVFAVLFSRKTFEEALDHIASLGLQAIEIGVGGYVGNAHCKQPDAMRHELYRRLQAIHHALYTALAGKGLYEDIAKWELFASGRGGTTDEQSPPH